MDHHPPTLSQTLITPPLPTWRHPHTHAAIGNEGSLEQVCAQGKNMSRHVVQADGWQLVAFDKGTRFPTYGYETSSAGKPLVLEVDTTTARAGEGAGVLLTYTRGKTGYGNATVT